MESFSVLKIMMLLSGIQYVFSQSCLPKLFGKGSVVCVCNATYCDKIQPIEKVNAPYYVVYTSNKAGQRFIKSSGQFSKVENSGGNTYYVNSDKKYQEIFGFGGAITDSAGINIQSLSESTKENLMKSYFGDDGIEYNFIRVPIGATDFSERYYSYADSTEPDPELNHFALTHEDYDYKIPLIHIAQELNPSLKLIACAWTVPKWMKMNNDYIGIFGLLRNDMYQPLANYHIKFLDAYKEKNISFWGISTGNEPTLGFTVVWAPNVAFSPVRLAKWIAENFGPTIRNSTYSDIKILVLDEQRIFVPYFVDAIFSANPRSRDYVDGIALHWYLDGLASTANLEKTHQLYPEKFILGTEASIGSFELEKVIFGSWKRAEDYASGIIENMKSWFVGWIDWNLVLNEKGGPTTNQNFIDAPIIVKKSSDEFYKQPMFYAIGHFSKFVPAKSVRIDISSKDFWTTINENLATLSFLRPDNGITVIVLNKQNREEDVRIVDVKRNQQFKLHLTRHSIQTIVYW